MARAPKKAAVLGFPVGHSLSPRLHGYWLRHYHIEGSYEAIAVEPQNLELFLRDLPQHGFAGVNLTIPHKEQALSFLDEIDPVAQRIGAVNTVIVKDGKLHGTNTDAYGFMANLNAQMPGLAPGKALVLGAGGAARAVCAGLLDAGWQVAIAGRTMAKAQAIAEALPNSCHSRAGGNLGQDPRLRGGDNVIGSSIMAIAWNDLAVALPTTTLLVNTTPLGMKGQQPLAIPLDALPKTAMVADIVYSPLMTLLLAQAKARGNPVVTGLGMLLYQAQPAFEAFFGIRPEVTDALIRHMQESVA